MPSVIKFVSAPCGSGKTHAIFEWVRRIYPPTSMRPNLLYIAPTRALIGEVSAGLSRRGIEHRIFTSDTHPNQVIGGLVHALKNANRNGEVILTTHRAFEFLPYFHRRDKWVVLIDEVPQVDRFTAPKLPRHVRLLTDHLTIQKVNEGVGRLVPKDGSQLRKHLENPSDDAEACVADIWRDAVSATRQLYVGLRAWDRVAEKRECSKSDEGNLLPILSMPDPSLYAGSTILGANLEHSLLFAWLRKRDVTLMEDTRFTRHLRYRTYPEATINRLSIDYLLHDRAYSKYLRDTKTGNKGVQADLDQDVRNEVGDKPFLLVVNQDYRGELAKLPNATLMSPLSHGLNCYAEHTTLVFMAALNRTPVHTKMLQELGLSSDVIRTSSCFETAHQCLMRTNLRVPNSDEQVRIIVADRFMADYLVHVFPGVEVRKIGTAHYTAREPLSKTDRNRRWELDVFQSDFEAQHAYVPMSEPVKGKLVMTRHDQVSARDANDFRMVTLTALELKNFLKKSAKTVQDTKDERGLFNLTAFEAKPGSISYRTSANIKSIHGFILDFDGGTLSPQEFVRLFWTDAGPQMKRSFVIFNTFSRPKSTPIGSALFSRSHA